MQAQWAAAKAEEVKRFAKSVELRAWLVPELRALCEVRGLRKTGKKAELVARLCDELCKPEPAAKRPRTEASAARVAPSCLCAIGNGTR